MTRLNSIDSRPSLKENPQNGPRVSIVMPTYRQCSFIPRAVQTLLAQKFEDWELIGVDDGSPDETQEVMRSWKDDPRIRLVTLPRNTGLGAAINRGLDEARADLVT